MHAARQCASGNLTPGAGPDGQIRPGAVPGQAAR
jgi:hypothetical protein